MSLTLSQLCVRACLIVAISTRMETKEIRVVCVFQRVVRGEVKSNRIIDNELPEGNHAAAG